MPFPLAQKSHFCASPEKFTVKDAKLTVFKGDSMDADAVEKAIARQDAVISTLGPTRPPVPHMMEISGKNIVVGMKKTWSTPTGFDNGRRGAPARRSTQIY
ncbi:MAG TPA: NAD(P)H-binding protein [Anaerolineales bacterium]|nr:hypothetical protein [Anaerolineae bacterium]HRJ56614.1 NAD(P)H-binding protein [Anaerolineales bacterium]HRK87648.1 NAD(P)H-binding protein [Anaerolineales bacterium]